MAPIDYDTTLPLGAWDSHVHIVDEDIFHLHPDHPYRPRKADLNDLLQFEKSNGIEHVCLVAFSVYGTDNRSILDALVKLKGKGRAVVCIDPDEITDKELRSMHGLGVRGVRLNLRTRSQTIDPILFTKLLRKYADKIRPLGWALQIYTSLDQIKHIAAVIPSLGIPIVFDHLGSPEGTRPPKALLGYSELMSLLKEKLVYVKLSGTYRFPNTPGIGEYVEEILRCAPTQVVWASDWPHSGGVSRNPGGDRKKVQEYRVVSTTDFIVRCKEWCKYDEDLIQKIWVENPRRLWQYDAQD
ncbi:amidohydrolase 2 [Mollisia scopiformis]|uniref:Amidohydrolase 2 n=1 Tax=Mollisia scopiformis TaxID=149040 RepID=A0A132B5G9_MOLSC|nr:amidohydrolase 2 [Mollisia scopiformis]KUJ07655.1 amidohydrolase 2 [Mollisia scopiformis]